MRKTKVQLRDAKGEADCGSGVRINISAAEQGSAFGGIGVLKSDLKAFVLKRAAAK